MNRMMMVLLLIFGSAMLAAQSPADSLTQRSAKAGPASDTDHAATLSRLEQQEDRGVRNADLYYNIGVCHYHLGDQARAVLDFLRALNLDSAHHQARENLAYVNSLNPDLADEQQPYLAQLFLRIYDFFSLNRLALTVLVFALLTTISLHLLFHYPQERERGLPVLLVMISAILLLVFGGALLVKQHRHLRNPKAVVLTQAEIRSAPRSGRKLKDLAPATTVSVKEASPSQFQVVLPDGMSGWIERQAVELVVPDQKF